MYPHLPDGGSGVRENSAGNDFLAEAASRNLWDESDPARVILTGTTVQQSTTIKFAEIGEDGKVRDEDGYVKR